MVKLDAEEDEPVQEPSWPHLLSAYDFFIRFILSGDVDTRVLKQFIDMPFVLKVIELFNSEDQREREYLKSILHRIYAKFMALRGEIRKAINNVFLTLVYEETHHNGIAELLEIIGSIIKGFAEPIKQEHKNFLVTVLLPMHKIPDVQMFHPQLQYCVTQFVEKDAKLAPIVLRGLMKYWPVSNSVKETLFLNELEELLELTQPPQFAEVLDPLCRFVSKRILSEHFQIAERTLYLWHNETIGPYFSANRAAALPLLYPALQRASSSHWNPTVAELTASVLKIFQDTDPALTARVAEEANVRAEAEAKLKVSRQDAWAVFTAHATEAKTELETTKDAPPPEQASTDEVETTDGNTESEVPVVADVQDEEN
jgi:serine/threonine-protein phosphatase 2A regulatory subunit B'